MRYTVRVVQLEGRWRAEVDGMEAAVEVAEWAQIDTEVRSLLGDLTGAWPDDLELEYLRD
jgi:hypothetical protein